MPVRSLNSAVLKWPDPQTILREAQAWAINIGKGNKNINRIYCFGSLAADKWGVGSDLDILIELHNSTQPFISRSSSFDATGIQVPVEILVYTYDELCKLRKEKRRFIIEFDKYSIVLYDKELSD